MQQRIKLVHSAMNPDFAIIENMVVKLSFAERGETNPLLEVFENTKWAQEKEWTCYGPAFDENDEWAGQHIEFNELGDIRQVQIGDSAYEIMFVHSGKEKFQYPASVEDVKFYEFLVSELNKSADYSKKLKSIARYIHETLLKPLGYKKKGNTFNRETADGLVHVINFQMSAFELNRMKNPLFISVPYGNFTINLGVCIPEAVSILLPYKKKGGFVNEYDCQIRARIGSILESRKDIWFSLDEETDKLNVQIQAVLQKSGVPFLQEFETREDIEKNLRQTDPRYDSHVPSVLLSIVALHKGDTVNAQRLLQGYYDQIQPTHSGHKKYIKELSDRLGLKIELSEVAPLE